MEGQEEKKVEKTWKPTAAGILAIISGAIGCIYRVILYAVFSPLGLWGLGAPSEILLLMLGVVAIDGGVCALKRKSWGTALAGSICALFSPLGIPLGILAIIFVAIGKSEFN